MNNYITESAQKSSLDAALELHKTLDCNIFPLPRASKVPNRPWREFQHRKLTTDEIVALFEQADDANIAVVCGRVSENLVVLDCDAPDVLKRLGYGVPVTPVAETARGRHYYFRGRARTTHLSDGLDVRADGAYVVAPPSLHPSGKPYQWVIPPGEADPAPCPAWLQELLRKRTQCARTASPVADILNGVPEGRRNIASAKLIGYLFAHLPQEAWESVAWPLVRGWNQLNQPPLDERQLRYTFDSIARKEATKARRDDEKLLRVVRVLLKNSQISLRKLSKEASVSRNFLSAILKSLPP